ncbi:MAG: methyltransferase [Pseudomonadota bacterium]
MPSLTWPDRWFGWRNRLLSSSLFQRRASSFALTRPIAQRRARELFDLVAGFVYSQVLLACVRLRLFDILSEGPQTADALAQRLGLPTAGAQRLLSAAASLRLVELRSQGRYGLGVLGAPMVGNAALAAMVEHHTALYADLADPVALLRGEAGPARLAAYWPYALNTEAGQAQQGLLDGQVAGYSALMSASQPLVAGEILDAWPMARHHCLLDIGGGEATFLMQAAARAPGLKLMLFDLPAVAQRGRQRMVDAGLGHRASATGGDFFRDALPQGADIATLVRVVHDHDDAGVLTLLRAVHSALLPGGTLLLAEPMAGTSGAEPMGDAYFGIYLLAMGRGQPRTEARLTELLEQAGFTGVRRVPTRMPLQTSILVATAGCQMALQDQV